MSLVDTAPLVAIVDPGDVVHATAFEHLGTLAPAGLWVCEPVLTEACFHLPHRMQRERLRAALDEFYIDLLPTGRRRVLERRFRVARQIRRSRARLGRRLHRRAVRAQQTSQSVDVRSRVPDDLAAAGREGDSARDQVKAPAAKVAPFSGGDERD
jgi:hypothetical protein